MKKGIDVSQWQGDINWGAANADFAILRAGYGRVKSQIDTKFEQNYRNAKAVGMPLGAYWYSYAMSADEAREEAKVFLEIIKGKQFEYPVYFDVEEAKTLALGRDRVSDIIIAFLEEMEKAGYFAGLYMSASPLTTHTTEFVKKRFAIWVANYGVSKPSYSGQYGMWQYSSTGKVNGIGGNVDMNECYVDYPKQIKADGKNGFEKPKPEEPKPEPVPEPTPEPKTIDIEVVIDGVKYAGTLTEKK